LVRLQAPQYFEATGGRNSKWPSPFRPLGWGRVSDKQITRESGVLDLLSSGDNVMVDRGFEIKDIVPDGVMVNMPPF